MVNRLVSFFKSCFTSTTTTTTTTSSTPEKPELPSSQPPKQQQQTKPQTPPTTTTTTSTMSPQSIAIITTSVRSTRVGPAVAEIVTKTLTPLAAATNGAITLKPIDLLSFNLPLFNEPVAPMMVPAQAQFSYDYSKKWSAEIAQHAAYIFVIPEYNGMTGATKNCIDYLLNEWKGKPVAIVSYGSYGGSRASEQVKNVLDGMGLRVAETRPQLKFGEGGPGPEIFAALSQGVVVEETRSKWEGEGGAMSDVKKAFQELRALLEAPVIEKEEKKQAE